MAVSPALDFPNPDGDHLLLSPHLDDAMFSAAGLIQRLSPHVWTVFAGVPPTPRTTEWDRRCGYDDAQSLMRDRRAEDEAAFAGTGCVLRHLDALERAYSTPARRQADLAALLVDVERWLAEGSDPVVWLPVGAGVQMPPSVLDRPKALARRLVDRGHARTPAEVPTVPGGTDTPTRPRGPRQWIRTLLHAEFQLRRRYAQRRGMLANEDHLALRDSVAGHLAGRRGVTVAFYEELPYLWSRAGQPEADRLAGRYGIALHRHDRPVDVPDKHRRMARYATQVVLMDPELRRLTDVHTLPARETYWW